MSSDSVLPLPENPVIVSVFFVCYYYCFVFLLIEIVFGWLVLLTGWIWWGWR
jgi:hypothetical protein